MTIGLQAERELSIESQRVYEQEIYRDPPWKVTPDGITIPRSSRIITAEMLSKKKIPDRIAQTLLTYKRIEDQLGPYAEEAFKYATGIEGYVSFYAQWVREEYWHPRAIRFILTHAPNNLNIDFGADYFENTQKRFAAPYQSRRKNLYYTAIQESMTNQSYNGVIEALRQADCEEAAEGIRPTSLDEAFHRGALIRFVKLEAKFNPDGVVEDAIEVSSNFIMPALDKLPNPRAELRNMYVTLQRSGYNIRDMGKYAIKGFLKEVPGVTQEQIAQVLATAA